MPDGNVEILFRTTAELEGALAAQRELEKTRGKLLALGKSTEEVDQQLARANELIQTAPAEMRETAEAANQAREGFGGAAHSAGGLRHVIGLIHHESPLAAEALHALMHPATGGILLAAFAVNRLIEYFKELSKEAEIGGKFEGFAEAFKSQEKALTDAELSAGAYERSLLRGADATKTLAQATALEIDLLKAKARQQDEERGADLAKKKAEIDAQEKAGAIDAVAAIRLRAQAEDAFAKEKLDRDAKLARSSLELHQRERETLRAGLPEEETGLRAAQRAFALAETPETVRERIKKAQDLVTATKEEERKAEEVGAGPERRTAARQAVEVAEEALEKEKQTAFRRLDEYNQLKEELESRAAAVKATRARLEVLSAELNKLVLLTESDLESRGRVVKTEQETRGIQGGAQISGIVTKAGPQIVGAAEEAKGLFAAGGISKGEAIAQAIEDKGLRGHQELILQVIERFSGIANKMDAGNQELFQVVTQRLSDLERRLGTFRAVQN